MHTAAVCSCDALGKPRRMSSWCGTPSRTSAGNCPCPLGCGTGAAGTGTRRFSVRRTAHRGPFVIVFVDTHSLCNLSISTYSSDTGTWSDRIFPHQPLPSISISLVPCAHVGNALYFRLEETPSTALKYDLCLREMSAIRLPPTSTPWQPLVLTSREDGGLGCATVHEFKLYMWSRKDGPQVDAGWTQNRVIDIGMLLQRNAI
jgi:hypothetical protein